MNKGLFFSVCPPPAASTYRRKAEPGKLKWWKPTLPRIHSGGGTEARVELGAVPSTTKRGFIAKRQGGGQGVEMTERRHQV